MQSKIQHILDQAYFIYRQENSSTVEFCDLMLSSVSFVALCTATEALLPASAPLEILWPMSMLGGTFKDEDLSKPFGFYNDRPENDWYRVLLVDSEILRGVPFKFWQYVLPSWADLFKNLEVGERKWLLEKTFGKIELMLAEEQKDKQLYLTPKSITEVMAYYLSSENGNSLYDPFARSGDLLVNAGRKIPSINKMEGISPVKLAWKLSVLRLLFSEMACKVEFHDLEPQGFLASRFDLIVSNPPFGYRRPDANVSVDVPKDWADIAEKSSREEVVFLCHILGRLTEKGRAAVLLPSIFLSRNMSTSPVIKRMVEKNLLDAVVSLPSGLFEHTGISIVLMAINKGREDGDRVLLADASSKFSRKGRKSILDPHVIIEWLDRLKGGKGETEEQFALVTSEEIAKNNFGLNAAYYQIHEEEIKKRRPSKTAMEECRRLEHEIGQVSLELTEFLAERKTGWHNGKD